jgi:hypothetical protein
MILVIRLIKLIQRNLEQNKYQLIFHLSKHNKSLCSNKLWLMYYLKENKDFMRSIVQKDKSYKINH